MDNDPVGNADPSGLEVGYDYSQHGVMRPGIDTSQGFNRTAAGIALGALAVATAPEFAVAGMMGSIARGFAAAGLQQAARTWGAAAAGYVGAGLLALWTGVSTGLRGSGRCPTRNRRGFAYYPQENTQWTTVGNLRNRIIHSERALGQRNELSALSDAGLLRAVNNPSGGDFMKISQRTGGLVDGNSRARELLKRADCPRSSINESTNVRYIPHNPDPVEW